MVETLEAATKEYGTPKRIQVDKGPEFVAKEVDLWAYANGVLLDFSRPGRPADNPFIETFNSYFRQEYLIEHWFLSLENAKDNIEGRRHE